MLRSLTLMESRNEKRAIVRATESEKTMHMDAYTPNYNNTNVLFL